MMMIKKKKKNIERFFYQTIIKYDEVFFSLLLFLSPQRESEICLRRVRALWENSFSFSKSFDTSLGFQINSQFENIKIQQLIN